MKVINLTPHDVNICDDYGNIIKTYKASGIMARMSNRSKVVDYVDGVPIKAAVTSEVVGLLPPSEGTLYIVSRTMLSVCSDRMDLIAPVDKVHVNGRVIGCKSFMSNR